MGSGEWLNPPTKWYDEHSNLVLLAHYLADQGENADTVAYAMEKPWKFEDEFNKAQEEQDDSNG